MTTSIDPSISVCGLTKFYGDKRGVEEVSFDVLPGEIVGFLGPNGSGKTTVMRMLMGLIYPTSGTIQILNNVVSRRNWQIRSQMGYLPGILSLYKDMTVRDYLIFIASVRNVECSRRMNELMERFSLSPTAEISGLSKGTKQKVGVVQALMHSPRILILDEPTSGLDPIVQNEFEAVIREQREKGISVLLSSHVMHEVDELADRVIILFQGRVIVVDSIDALKSRTARILRLEFPTQQEPTIFMGVPGVEEVLTEGRFVECTILGSENALLKEAAAQGVIGVISEEPSLEDIFLVQTGMTNAH